MGRPAKPTPIRFCQVCGEPLQRKRLNGTLEDLTHFGRRVTCGRHCMARRMQKDRCRSESHSRSKAHRHIKACCETCGSVRALHVHHIDEDHTNNAPSNLRTLCASCHRRCHSPNFMADGVTRKPCKHCVKPSAQVGLCWSHLNRLRKYGDALAVKIRTKSGWVLDTSGLPVRSRRSQ